MFPLRFAEAGADEKPGTIPSEDAVFIAPRRSLRIINRMISAMFEQYRCPYCEQVNNIELARVLAEGETDLRGRIDERQQLKLDLPARLLIICESCGREFIIKSSSPSSQ